MKLYEVDPPVAVEEMIVHVTPGMEDFWVKKDTEIWSAALETCPGFLGKEIWLNRDVPGQIVVIIYWQSYDAWQSLDRQWVMDVEERMTRAVGQEHIKSISFAHRGSQKFKAYEYR